MMSEEKTEVWLSGYKCGENIVFEFLKDMTFMDTKKLRKHFDEWSNAEEWTTLNGVKKGR